MPFTLEELTKPLTVDQVRLSIYATLAQIGVDTTTWKPGGVVRTMIAATSILISALSRLTAEIAKGGFLESAEGDWLTLLARNVYGVERITATFGTAPAVVGNSSGGIYTLSDGEMQVTNQRTGAVYVNVGPLNIPALSSSIPTTLVAREAGSASTALVSDPLVVSSPLPGVSVGLLAALVGNDEEADPALRLRCGEKLGALSPNGPPDAYAFVARSALRPDGSAIGVTRVRLTNDGFGNVDVYVADPSGAIDPLDLDTVDLAIQTQCAPLAVTARVHNVLEVPVAINAHVYMYENSGQTTASIQSAIAAELADFFANQPIGGNRVGPSGFIYRNAIEAAIGRTSDSLKIFNVVLTDPAGDVALAINQVATLDTVTIVVSQFPAPGTL